MADPATAAWNRAIASPGAPVVVALGTHANKQGRIAGTNIAGGEAALGGVLGTAITRFKALEIARTGLAEREAAAARLDAFAVTTEALNRALYYPGTQSMQIVAELGTGRLLDAPIVGGVVVLRISGSLPGAKGEEAGLR